MRRTEEDQGYHTSECSKPANVKLSSAFDTYHTHTNIISKGKKTLSSNSNVQRAVHTTTLAPFCIFLRILVYCYFWSLASRNTYTTYPTTT